MRIFMLTSTFAALSLAAPAGLLAQESPPPAPPAPPAASPAPAPAPAPGPAAPRIEFVREPVIQSVAEPKTGERPVCRGEVVDSCIQPGAARQQSG